MDGGGRVFFSKKEERSALVALSSLSEGKRVNTSGSSLPNVPSPLPPGATP